MFSFIEIEIVYLIIDVIIEWRGGIFTFLNKKMG